MLERGLRTSPGLSVKLSIGARGSTTQQCSAVITEQLVGALPSSWYEEYMRVTDRPCPLQLTFWWERQPGTQ